MNAGGQVDPAVRPQPTQGKEARGKVLAGLGLEAIRIAIPMFPKEDEMWITLAETAAKLGKMLKKPPEDLGQAELKFLGSQLYPQQKPAAMDSGGAIRQNLMSQGAQAPPTAMAGAGSAPGAGPQGGA